MDIMEEHPYLKASLLVRVNYKCVVFILSTTGEQLIFYCYNAAKCDYKTCLISREDLKYEIFNLSLLLVLFNSIYGIYLRVAKTGGVKIN